MTPKQKIKHAILNIVAKWADAPAPDVTAENVEEAPVEAPAAETEAPAEA